MVLKVSMKSLGLLVIKTGLAIIGLKFKSCGCAVEMYSLLDFRTSFTISFLCTLGKPYS